MNACKGKFLIRGESRSFAAQSQANTAPARSGAALQAAGETEAERALAARSASGKPGALVLDRSPKAQKENQAKLQPSAGDAAASHRKPGPDLPFFIPLLSPAHPIPKMTSPNQHKRRFSIPFPG